VNKFTRTYIIGLGFLSGVFIGIGFDPKEAIISFFLDILAQHYSEIAIIIRAVVAILGLITTYLSWTQAYKKRGVIGVIIVLTAFAGGLFLGMGYWLGLWLSLGAIAFGILFLKKKKTLGKKK
jgi:hypothetical protein